MGEREACPAFVSEVIGASDKAFSGFLRVDDRQGTCSTAGTFADYSLLQFRLSTRFPESESYLLFFPFPILQRHGEWRSQREPAALAGRWYGLVVQYLNVGATTIE